MIKQILASLICIGFMQVQYSTNRIFFYKFKIQLSYQVSQ